MISRKKIRYQRNSSTLTSIKYQISGKFSYHGIEKIDIWEIWLATLTSRKHQIYGKFGYLDIEKKSDIREIQLPWHRDKIRYLGNSATMTSRKNQISGKFSYHDIEKKSDIREIQLPWHRDKIRYLGNSI